MLFQLWKREPHRATKDIDFLLIDAASLDEHNLRVMLAAICNNPVIDDGLWFDSSSLYLADIREEDRYGGMRAKIKARLGAANIIMQIDIGFGDTVTPAPEQPVYPTMLDMPAPHILAYPRETVVAEKLEAIADLGLATSRMKDYFDLWYIATTFENDPQILATAVRRTFARRRQELPDGVPAGLSDEFASDPLKRRQWAAFVRQRIDEAPSLEVVVSEVRDFALPAIAAARDALPAPDPLMAEWYLSTHEV